MACFGFVPPYFGLSFHKTTGAFSRAVHVQRRDFLPVYRTIRSPHRTVGYSFVTPTASHGNNGVADETSEDYKEEDVESLAPDLVKQKLLRIIDIFINSESQLSVIERSILRLESLKATPITADFTEMVLAGEWRLCFSSLRTRANNSVRIRKISQRFDIDAKQLVNNVTWSFPAKKQNGYIDATLNVICSYVFVGPGRMQISLDKHKVTINNNQKTEGQELELPDDWQAVISELRLALPIEHFDPSGLLDISYIEPDFRISRFLGKRLAGVRNILTRVS